MVAASLASPRERDGKGRNARLDDAGWMMLDDAGCLWQKNGCLWVSYKGKKDDMMCVDMSPVSCLLFLNKIVRFQSLPL